MPASESPFISSIAGCTAALPHIMWGRAAANRFMPPGGAPYHSRRPIEPMTENLTGLPDLSGFLLNRGEPFGSWF
jgi:hypothetical protein